MTIIEALTKIQKKRIGITAKKSALYAQSLLLPDEKVVAAITANIRTRRDKYPGVVVITSMRIMAACGLPGIKRCAELPLEDLENCEEASTVIQYKATFRTRRDSISIDTDPDTGEVFSRFVARLNGESLDAVKVKVTGNVLNPTFLQQKKRNQIYKEQAKARDLSREIDLQKKAAALFDSSDDDDTSSL